MADEFHPERILETQDTDPDEQGDGSGGVITPEVLKQILDEQRRANESVIQAAVSRRAEPGVPLQQDDILPEINFSLDGLPDPALDPRAFHTEYAKRWNVEAQKFGKAVQHSAAARVNQATADAQVRQRVEGLIKQHMPDVTDRVLGVAAQGVAGRYRQSGKDPMAELRSRPEEVAQEIADWIDDLAAEVGAPKRMQARQDDGDEGRTAGLVTPRGRIGAPSRQRQTDPKDRPDPNSMYRELTRIQRESRIY